MINIFNIFKGLTGKAKDLNDLTVMDYYDRIKLIALSLFEWENLPESCNVKFLEETLYMYGRALFINKDTLGYLNTKCTPSAQLNHYNEPIKYVANTITFTEEFDRNNCVLIRNNYLERPTDYTVMLFAQRLANIERTIDVNVNAQKTPFIVRCDEKDRLTLKNLYKQYEGNEPFILGAKGMNVEALKTIETNAPYLADKLQILKQQMWNEMLTFFGINNANNEKRERLITDEVNANNEVIQINAEAMLLTRKEACKKINDMYGLSVDVKLRCFNEEYSYDDTEESEVENNG